jgi:hypothetical protein
MRTPIAALALLGLMAAPALADPINSDAPDLATGSFVIAPRVYQLEQNVQVDFAAGVPTLSFPSLHRFGLVDSLELRLDSPIIGWNSAGVSRQDITLGAKWNLEKLLPSSLPPLALLPIATLDPTNQVTPGVHLLTDFELPLGIGLNGDVGGSFPLSGPAGVNHALSFSRDINDTWRGYAEYAGNWDPTAGLGHSIDGGVIYTLDDDTQLMAAVLTDIAKPFDTWYVTTNYSHRWGK